MIIAIWIIAICEVIRMLQNFIQIWQIKKANGMEQMNRATDAFVKSLNKTDAEFVEDFLEKFKEQNYGEITTRNNRSNRTKRI